MFDVKLFTQADRKSEMIHRLNPIDHGRHGMRPAKKPRKTGILRGYGRGLMNHTLICTDRS
jgi:hypothetical protein